MTTEPRPLPKWKIDTMEAAIQDLQRVKVPITASRIHKCTGPSVTLDEYVSTQRTGLPIPKSDRAVSPLNIPALGRHADTATNGAARC